MKPYIRVGQDWLQENGRAQRKKRGTPFHINNYYSYQDRRLNYSVIIPPYNKTPNQRGVTGLINALPSHCFSFYINAFSTPLPLWCGRGFPFVRAPGARVLPGYKPTNGVLTAAALLHCRRAETNRIRSTRCARLPFLSARSVRADERRARRSKQNERNYKLRPAVRSWFHKRAGMKPAGLQRRWRMLCFPLKIPTFTLIYTHCEPLENVKTLQNQMFGLMAQMDLLSFFINCLLAPALIEKLVWVV